MSYILNPLFYFTEATGIGSNSNQAQHVGLTGTMDFEAAVHIATTTFVSVGAEIFWVSICQLPGRTAIGSMAEFGKIV
jgi:hypothetical protein